MMPRNLDRRVELMIPVISRKIVRHLRDTILQRYLADNQTVRIGKADGTYEASPAGSEDSQSWFMAHRAETGE